MTVTGMIKLALHQVTRLISALLLSAGLTAPAVLADDLWVSSLQSGSHPDFEYYVASSAADPALKQRADVAVATQMRRFAASPDHLYRVTFRSRWFAHYLIQRCQERQLPIELALLPMVESAFDPFAYSQGGAAGLWQFMPATAREFGLESSWWFDERRDLIASTEAALDYLERLHQRFDNWLLAVAAYNAGPTRISRALRSNRKQGGSGSFWELDLPRETASYVPRLLALKDMLLNRKLSNIGFYDVADEPAFVVIELPGQVDLSEAADWAGEQVSIDDLYLLNAGLSRWATPPEGPHRLLVPVSGVLRFETQLASASIDDRLQWRRYRVVNGDTLGGIAQRHDSRVASIQLANSIDGSNIRVGQQLLIPYAQSGAQLEPAELRRQLLRMKEVQQGLRRVDYRVVAGDSWWLLARRFGTSVESLLGWNNASAKEPLRVGRELTIWQRVDRNRRDVLRTIYYKVKRGDSLARIANRFEVPVEHIVAHNKLDASRYLQPGQNLSIRVKVAGQ